MARTAAALFLCTLVRGAAGAASPGVRCGHDRMMSSLPADRRRLASSYAGPGARELGAGAVFTPIRIVPIYVEVDTAHSLSAAQVSFVRTIVPEAAARWAGLLSVQAGSGPLFASRACDGYNRGLVYPNSCVNFAADTQCQGVAGDVPISFTYSYPSYLEGGAGLAGADVGLFITARQTADCGTSTTGGQIAYAITCGYDGYTDRPTWIRVNLCPGMFNPPPAPASVAYKSLYNTVLHEMAHGLGFSSYSFTLFRNPDNSPRTPRTAWSGEPSGDYLVGTCSTGSSGSFSVSAVPAKTTVNFFPERGTTCSWDGATAETSSIPFGARGKLPIDCVARIVTPTVVQAARDFYGCNTLPGAELENQDTSSCEPIGSHWEMRALNTELMGAYTQHASLISPLLLAVFQDSGWCVWEGGRGGG